MKHLLKMSDLSPAELHHILDVAEKLKAEQKAGTTPALLKGRSVALMFSKNSTRTRTSFEVGVYQLGGLGNYMNAATELQSGRGEPLKDTARVLGRYYDCVVWRTYRQCDLEEFAELAGVPVINGLTDYAHPCQVLADLMTIRERRGTLEGQKLCFIGDGCSMANSLIVGGLLAGMRVTCVCPEGYRPAADVLMFAHKHGEKFHLLTDPAEGVKDADVVVRDRKAVTLLVRNALFTRVRLFAAEKARELGELDEEWGWREPRWRQAMERFFDEHEEVLLDGDARSSRYLTIDEADERSEHVWHVRQMFHDADADDDFGIAGDVDLDATQDTGEVVFRELNVGFVEDLRD